jgi:hypothetical protein
VTLDLVERVERATLLRKPMWYGLPPTAALVQDRCLSGVGKPSAESPARSRTGSYLLAVLLALSHAREQHCKRQLQFRLKIKTEHCEGFILFEQLRECL